jgi:hypothetical protein
MNATAFCQLCGNQIAGKSRQFHHKDWPPQTTLRVCLECVRHKTRCPECGIPMAARSRSGICETCLKGKPLCLSCNQNIIGQSLNFDGIGPYCLDCYKNRPLCDICGAPVTNEQWRLSDGRLICAHCHLSSIFTPTEAAGLFTEMKSILFDLLGLKLNIPTGLALVDQNQLSDVVQQQAQYAISDGKGDIVQDSEQTLGLYARRGMRRGIYVLSGLPRTLFLQIAAHEFAHAWQGENCPKLNDALIQEGFAEWVAFKVLGTYGRTDSQNRMRNRQDIYGQGLRWALKTEESQGKQAVVDACRSSFDS